MRVFLLSGAPWWYAYYVGLVKSKWFCLHRTPIANQCRTMTLAARRRGFVGPNWRYLVALEFPDRLLTPGEVALLFRVDPKTVTRWASSGRIGSIRTPGGHRRFRESEVNVLLADLTFESSQSTI
jgi:excisionase family DNA binding protein